VSAVEASEPVHQVPWSGKPTQIISRWYLERLLLEKNPQKITIQAVLVQKEREEYEVVIEDGKFMFKKSRQILDTSGGARDAKWIFVLSTSKNLYVGQVIFSCLGAANTQNSFLVHHLIM
jgi:hypothetical protein